VIPTAAAVVVSTTATVVVSATTAAAESTAATAASAKTMIGPDLSAGRKNEQEHDRRSEQSLAKHRGVLV
jgi:hypothetical protein